MAQTQFLHLHMKHDPKAQYTLIGHFKRYNKWLNDQGLPALTKDQIKLVFGVYPDEGDI